MIKLNQPRISKLNSWDVHVERVIEVTIEALSLFHSDEGINKLKKEFSIVGDWREIENKLNTVLYFFLCKANRDLKRKKKGLNTFPQYEPQNKNNPDDRTIEAIKRPVHYPQILTS